MKQQETKTNQIPFWIYDPTVLFDKEYILEVYPTNKMSYEEKMNSITRLIILITLFIFLLKFSIHIILIGCIALLCIIFIYNIQRKRKISKETFAGNFATLDDRLGEATTQGQIKITNPETLKTHLKNEFYDVSKKNPFSNVLLPEINENPERKPAPPAFNMLVEGEITDNVKKMVQYVNPQIKNTDKQLYGGLYENWELDQSNRIFYSTANTRVANDQGAFAKFLYGNMYSCRGGDEFACVQDNYRWINP